MENESQHDELIESSEEDIVEENIDDMDLETLKANLQEEKRQREEALKEVKTLQIKRHKDKEKFEKISQSKSSSTKAPDAFSERLSALEVVEKKREFGHKHSLSPAEVDAVYKNNPNPTKESLEDPFIKGGLEAIRAKHRVSNAIPSSKGRVPNVGGKSYAEMSSKERKDNWNEIKASYKK